MHTQRVERERDGPVIFSGPPSFWTTPIDLFFYPLQNKFTISPLKTLCGFCQQIKRLGLPPNGVKKSQIQFRCKISFVLFGFLKKFDDESENSAINEASKRLDGSLTDGNKANVMQCSPARRIQVQPIGNMLKLDGIVPGY